MFNRNIRVMDQTKRGSGAFVVFFSVPDHPNRVWWDLTGANYQSRALAYEVKRAITNIPENEYNYTSALRAAGLVN